jgi:glycosyltransferase involved in cell wall biosynthesis
MRIAFLTNNRFPPREGIGRHILEVGTRLRARGHEVTVLARGSAFGTWAETTVADLRVRHFPHYPLRPFHQRLAQQELARWLREGADGADLVHVHLPLLPPLLTEQPLVVTVHSPMLQDTAAIPEPGLWPMLIKANARLFSRRYEQWYLDHASRIVAVSHAVADELGRSYALRGRRPAVIPNGVDTGFFGFAPFGARSRSVLYVGRLGYRKGLPRLLDAFARLAPRPDQELVLVGEGPLEDALRRQATALGIASRVRFAGFLDREGVRRELAAACCLVNPADYESGPLTLLEAMASGTPVVTTPTGLAAEMGPGAPLVLSAAAPGALAEAIAVVLAVPEAALARARAARTLVVERFGWERVVDGLEAVYGLTPKECAA